MAEQLSSVETMRHSAAHLLAAAVLELYPDTKLGVGPVIEHGFFYDFLFPQAVSVDDLPKIEKKMREIQKRNEAFRREEMPLDAAIKFFQERKQRFKVELLRDLKTKGTTAARPEEEQDVDVSKPSIASVYWTGNFVDLCRGPHVRGTREIGTVKLTKVAGAYWRGSEKNSQLTRIYGLAFSTDQELSAHLKLLEEAERRDHRKLGKELDLFMISPQVGMGLPLWLPKGAFVRKQMEDLVRTLEEAQGYDYVTTPHIARKHLYETSGHWQHYRDSMYSPIDIEGEEYILRPMNCPHHIEIFRRLPRSYRELPMRIAEFGTVYRFEKSGELGGLTRVRGFTINDAHIFCTSDQIKSEVLGVIDLTKKVYRALGFKDYTMRLALRDPRDKEKYVALPKMWDQAEHDLKSALDSKKIRYETKEGEAAFYGPKVDIMFRDVLGREFAASTVQLDFSLPEKFELEYIGRDGTSHRPVMIHRAPLGSLERVFAFLIEHYAGAFPLWLSPVQVALIPVGSRHIRAAKKLHTYFKSRGIRSEVDAENETVGYKIRKAEKQKVPYMLVLGDKETKGLTPRTVERQRFVVRIRGKKDTLKLTGKQFVKRVLDEVSKRK